jgi:hypothetical protein
MRLKYHNSSADQQFLSKKFDPGLRSSRILPTVLSNSGQRSRNPLVTLLNNPKSLKNLYVIREHVVSIEAVIVDGVCTARACVHPV